MGSPARETFFKMVFSSNCIRSKSAAISVIVSGRPTAAVGDFLVRNLLFISGELNVFSERFSNSSFDHVNGLFGDLFVSCFDVKSNGIAWLGGLVLGDPKDPGEDWPNKPVLLGLNKLVGDGPNKLDAGLNSRFCWGVCDLLRALKSLALSCRTLFCFDFS